MTYLVARLSYEYGVTVESLLALPPMQFQAHIEVLNDLAKERENAHRGKKRARA